MWVWVCGVRLEAGRVLPGSLSARRDLCGRAGSRTSCRGSLGEDGLNLAVSGIEKHHSVRVHCRFFLFFMLLSRFGSAKKVCTMNLLSTKDDSGVRSLY